MSVLPATPSRPTAPPGRPPLLDRWFHLREQGTTVRVEILAGVTTFLTILLMPLTHSISTGLTFGFLAYVLLCLCAGRRREVHPVMWIIGLLAALNLLCGAV